MEKTNDKQKKKGKNKEKNLTQPPVELKVSSGSWSQRVSSLRRQNDYIMSAEVDPRKKRQQSGKGPTSESKNKQNLTKKGQNQKGHCKQSATVPKYTVLQRQSEDVPQKSATIRDVAPKSATIKDVPQKSATVKDVPQKSATNEDAPKTCATIEDVPQTSATVKDVPQKIAQQACEATDLPRGPVQRKKLWTPPPPYRTPIKPLVREVNGKARDGVETFPQQATTQVPELHLQQLENTEKEQTTKVQTDKEDLAGLLEQSKKPQDKACDGVETSPEQATIQASELEVQQLTMKKTEQANKIKSQNEALAAEKEQLKNLLLKSKALHDEAKLERESKLKDLELQLLERKTTEMEALRQVSQLEKALLVQKETQKQAEVSLAQLTEQNNALKESLTKAQTELESRQQQWQEERSRLTQDIIKMQNTLQEEVKARETRLESMMDQISKLEDQVQNVKKPKTPSLRKRFLRLFK